MNRLEIDSFFHFTETAAKHFYLPFCLSFIFSLKPSSLSVMPVLCFHAVKME